MAATTIGPISRSCTGFQKILIYCRDMNLQYSSSKPHSRVSTSHETVDHVDPRCVYRAASS